jgi:hypothetical protein
MVPPLVKDGQAPGGERAELDAPVVRWSQEGAYDTAESCEQGNANNAHLVQAMVRGAINGKDPAHSVYEYGPVAAAMNARCIPAEHIYPPAK